ncbi:acyl carrier protein [Lutibaculum baratangense]|uniref:Phosphopantetheine-binding protein n=1 Tax=Lutibaculum baratangense AMV1 TaxID=631454 RepID=V4RQQ9_9HYPH|nr:acyl carrier protein [Lutibaculum baratangense]ESR25465.1 phosphopantetheine-binding protein [Lutibaculum baratangense AMV1]
MTDADLMDTVMTTFFSVAPDLEGEPVEPEETFRKQFEIDSMDFLNFIIGLSKTTGLEIPEKDYPSLQTPNGAVAYLRARWDKAV